MPSIRAIVREAARNDYRLSAFILGVVNSGPFRMNKAGQELLTTETNASEHANVKGSRR
jgi:hypothetical protein